MEAVMPSADHPAIPVVTRVTEEGVWLELDGVEHQLPYNEFPWLRTASAAHLARIERPTPEHLRWPDLDVDLELDSIRSPESYPLIARSG